MARVHVHAVDIDGDKITRMQVKLGALPPRVIDRDTAIAWMRDMHSMIPLVDGKTGPALQLVALESDDDTSWFIRTDNAAEAADKAPELPAVRG